MNEGAEFQARGGRGAKWRALTFLVLAELLAMSLWFSASAVVPQLAQEWELSGSEKAWMTVSVQLGFVIGALFSALFNLADRVSSRGIFATCALLGAALNAAIPAGELSVNGIIVLRVFTGVALAGVYPPGMKLAATWSLKDRGLAIGLLVGALTLGSALPHLLNALPIFGDEGMPPWRSVLYASSALAVVAALLVALFVKPGPHLGRSAPFDWRFAARSFTERPLRLANFGYLGHMWELYAMWTWVPIFLIASYERAELTVSAARLAGFAVVASGALGSVAAGILADRVGRTTLAIASLVVSGACCLVAGLLFDDPVALTILCVIWGFAVVADSAQFSAAISELADPRYVGTALTVQTSAGFLLTLVSIQLIPPLEARFGWSAVFPVLAWGPVFGVVSLMRLRRLPEALKMASGKK